MTEERRKGLEKNFARMFWIRVFMNVKFLNIVISLFYLSRGLTLQSILFLAIVWAVTTMLFEIPSSYLADVWGRKKTILMAIGFALMQMSVFMFAEGFFEMAIGMFFYGLLSANISGTDIALIYDTKKELGQEETLSVIGKYWSGMNLGKIVSGIVGAYIAKDLTEMGFQILIVIDIIGIFIAGFFASRLVEPNHKMDVEKQEAGIIRDAVSLFKQYPVLFRAILNGEIVWLGMFGLWSYYQAFYHDLGVAVVAIGLIWSSTHFVSFFARYNIAKIFGKDGAVKGIRTTSIWILVGIGCITVGYYVSWNPYVLMVMWALTSVGWGLRRPLFDSYYNSFSFSFNRATTLSLTNLMHNVLEIPLMLGLGLLVGISPIYPYIAVFVLILFVLIFLRLPHATTIE